ncbi:putative mitochondrial protein AtMg00820 [Bidens hawaiensis]|uniref:putative mitochondrial protein AtMg00820 n=1 Tax=Bidens hawaiensis TaxID=980011 RepID=UPI00404B027A
MRNMNWVNIPSPILTYSRHPKAATTTQPTAPMPTHSTSQPTPPPTRTMQTRAMDGILKPKPHFNLNTTHVEPIPNSPKTALSTTIWRNAMQNEYDALIKNETWELVPRQPTMNIINCMWLFRHKFRSDGLLERYKARLVCDGRSQRVGVDCGETFSTVVKSATI